METVVIATENQRAWTIVCEDNCPVVRFLSHIIKRCDRNKFFRFVGRENADETDASLLRRLSASPWSLMLIDDNGLERHGPEAIPFILKNLPSGRLACVAYLIPGTMWLTRQLYLYVSRHRRKIATLTITSKQADPGKNAA